MTAMEHRTNASFILLLLLCLVSTSGFVVLAYEVVIGEEDWFDSHVFDFLKEHIGHSLIHVSARITFFGSFVFVVSVFAIVILWLVLIKEKKEAIEVAVIAVATVLLVEILKRLFQRSRPNIPLLDPLHNYSFPSGHAFFSFMLFSMLCLIIWKTGWARKWKIFSTLALFAFIIAIGISRIVLRYHYASDVVGGFCLGTSCFSGYLAYKVKQHKKFKSFAEKNEL